MEEKIAVHCKTEEEWDAVREKVKPGNPWEYDSNLPCIRLPDGSYRNTREHFVDDDLTIIPASEYLKEEEFKVGDRVECINIDSMKGSTCKSLILGKVYSVTSVSRVWLSVEGAHGSPHKERFKKVSTNQPKTTKKEEEMNQIIKDVFEKESSEVAQVINDEYGDEVSNTFGAAPKLATMFVVANKVEMITRAEKVIADAKKAAEKAAKEA